MGTPSSLGRQRATVLLALALSAASLWLGWLALPAAVGSLWAWLMLPRASERQTSALYRVLLIVAGLVACAGLVRFIQRQAVPGIVSAGNGAMERAAVSRLREVVERQDALRRAGFLDLDHDRVGSAALLSELAGWQVPRAPLPPGYTELKYPGTLRVQTVRGPAMAWGAYLFMVCLPTRTGGYSAEGGAEFDEEVGERQYLAYAWPRNDFAKHSFYVDQHEMIYISTPGVDYMGAENPPKCDAHRDARHWHAWQGKRPRKQLPGL